MIELLQISAPHVGSSVSSQEYRLEDDLLNNMNNTLGNLPESP